MQDIKHLKVGDSVQYLTSEQEPREGQIRVAFNGDEWLFHNGQWELGTSYLAFNQ